MCHMTYFNTSSHSIAMSVATKINILGLENFCMLYIPSTLILHADRFDLPHHLLQHCLTLNGNVHAVATNINFLALENFCMLYIASTLPLHADRFDVPHHHLLHYLTLHGHVCGHQDQLLGVGELQNAAHSVSLHANHFDVPHDLLQHLCPSSSSPWPPRSTACGWRT